MKKAIILAGGEGTRLRPITYEIPKPLIPVKKKPLINHIIGFLNSSGISDVGIIVNTKHLEDFEAWKKNWGDTFSDLPSFFVEENPSGTFGCLRLVKKWVGNESFVVANGDCLVDFDFRVLEDFYNLHKPVVAEPLMSVNTSGNYGIVAMDGVYVTGFSRKDVLAGSEFICGGPYIFEPTVFDYDEPAKKILNIEADIFPRIMAEKKIAGIKMEKSRFFDCGTLENWEKAIKEW